MNHPLRYLSIGGLLAVGLTISAYLLYRYFGLITAEAVPGTGFCTTLFAYSCDDALLSPISEQFGLPLAGWGLVYYVTLIATLALGAALGKSFRAEARLTAFGISVAGAGGSIILAGLMLSRTVPFCPLCVGVHLVNFGLVYPLYKLTERSLPDLIGAIRNGARYLIGAKSEDPTMSAWKAVGMVLIVTAAIMMYQWVLVQKYAILSSRGSSFDPTEAVAAYEATPIQNIPLSALDPVRGSSNAPVSLVVFSDFECAACRRFARTLKRISPQLEGKVAVVFKHFPLGTACNPMMNLDLHPLACEAAWTAEAARRQGKFWSFHDAVFDSDLSLSKQRLDSISNRLELNVAEFDAETMNESIRAKINDDVQLGLSLGVEGTPIVFLQGRQVFDLRARTLRLLVLRAIEENSTPENDLGDQTISPE